MQDLIKNIYVEKRAEIESRLREFHRIFSEGNDKDVFAELAFSLCTPQSNARACGKAVAALKKNGLLYTGTAVQIQKHLFGVRFAPTKSKRIVRAREQFSIRGQMCIKSALTQFSSNDLRRAFIVKEVCGIGYKEASHFLRNIGFGESFAILDRHILRQMCALGIIPSLPKTLTVKKYIEFEQVLRQFANRGHIPLDALDFVFFYMATGDIYK